MRSAAVVGTGGALGDPEGGGHGRKSRPPSGYRRQRRVTGERWPARYLRVCRRIRAGVRVPQEHIDYTALARTGWCCPETP